MKTSARLLFVISTWVLFFSGIVSANTVAWWRFEEGTPNAAASGTASIIDSANGFSGTPVGNPIYRSVFIPESSPPTTLALEFNGSASRIQIADNPAFYLTHSLTLEAFIRYDGQVAGQPYGEQIIFRGDDRPFFDPYRLSITPSGALWFMVTDAGNNQSSLYSPSPLPINVVLHVASTLDDATGQQRLFVNGAQVASRTTTIRPFGALNPSYAPGIGIGNLQSGNNVPELFRGLIDEVRISDQALSPSEFLNAVPEPSGIALMGVAILGLFLTFRSNVARNGHTSG
jgi:hypothetical protein